MEKGDVVSLKSGGPLMTVKKIEGTRVECQWFIKDTILETGFFDESMLQVRDEDEESGGFTFG